MISLTITLPPSLSLSPPWQSVRLLNGVELLKGRVRAGRVPFFESVFVSQWRVQSRFGTSSVLISNELQSHAAAEKLRAAKRPSVPV